VSAPASTRALLSLMLFSDMETPMDFCRAVGLDTRGRKNKYVAVYDLLHRFKLLGKVLCTVVDSGNLFLLCSPDQEIQITEEVLKLL
jgi:hypothetical protein